MIQMSSTKPISPIQISKIDRSQEDKASSQRKKNYRLRQTLDSGEGAFCQVAEEEYFRRVNKFIQLCNCYFIV